jgi:hypothetical protein
MKLYLTSLLLFFTFNVSASCDDAIDQVGYRLCIAKKAESSEKEVKAKQAELLNKIKTWDQEPEFRNETIKLFDKAVKSFESYKQHQCDYEWSAAAGGNGGSSMAFSCIIKLNKDYLKSLESQLNWYEPY